MGIGQMSEKTIATYYLVIADLISSNLSLQTNKNSCFKL